MTTLTQGTSLTIVFLLICVSDASLKRRIHSLESRLNHMKGRTIMDTSQTRSELCSLKDTFFSLSSSLAALNIKINSLSDKSERDQSQEGSASKLSESTAPKSEGNNQAENKGCISEEKRLKSKIRTTEKLLDTLSKTTQNNLADIHTKLEDQKRAFKRLKRKVRDIERIQGSLENKFNNYKSELRKLHKENAKYRKEMLQLSLHASREELLSKNLSCPDGWLPFRKRCYIYNDTLEKSFYSAREYCGTLNAYIADFENNIESNFIFSLTGSVPTWAGISDYIEEDQWISDRTNSNVTYTNWEPNDPDGDTRQNCVMLGYQERDWHLWIDAPCTHSYHFVCKKDAVGAK